MSRTDKFSTSFDRPIFCNTPVKLCHSRAFLHAHDNTIVHVCTSNNSTWGHEEHIVHIYISNGCTCSNDYKDMHTCTRFDMCTHTYVEYVHVDDHVPHLDRPRHLTFVCYGRALQHSYDKVNGGVCRTRCSQPRCSGSCIVPILLIPYIHGNLAVVLPVSHFLEAPSLSMTLHSKLHGYKKSRERGGTIRSTIVQIKIIATNISLNYKGSINLQRSKPNGEKTSRSLRSIPQLSRVGEVQSVGKGRFGIPTISTWEFRKRKKSLARGSQVLIGMPIFINIVYDIVLPMCNVYLIVRHWEQQNYVHLVLGKLEPETKEQEPKSMSMGMCTNVRARTYECTRVDARLQVRPPPPPPTCGLHCSTVRMGLYDQERTRTCK